MPKRNLKNNKHVTSLKPLGSNRLADETTSSKLKDKDSIPASSFLLQRTTSSLQTQWVGRPPVAEGQRNFKVDIKFRLKRRHDEKLKNFKLRLVSEERLRQQLEVSIQERDGWRPLGEKPQSKTSEQTMPTSAQVTPSSKK